MPVAVEPLPGATTPVWRDLNFTRIWISNIVSSLGSSITTLALPLIAIGALDATPAQMGILGAAGTGAFILLGLLAGVIVDRLPRRLVLATTSMAAGVVVSTIPLASALDALRIQQLYVVAFAASCVSVVAEVAFQAILPQVVGRDRVLEGNAIIRTTGAVTEIAGPSLAGVLVQALTAPVAIVLDALSFFTAGLFVYFVRSEESPAASQRQAVWFEIVEGVKYVVSIPALRAIALGGGMHNIFQNGAFAAIYILFATSVLGLTPVQIGFVFAATGPGALLGSLVAARYGRRFGMRNTFIQMQALTGIARAFAPLAMLVSQPLLMLMAGEFVLGFARSIFNVNQVSLRQSITPDRLQGRMTASIRFLMWSLVPAGALLGGFGANRIGIVAMLSVAVAGTFLASAWFILVPTDPRRTTTAARVEL